MVVPAILPGTDSDPLPDPRQEGDPPLHFLRHTAHNLRLSRFIGLRSIVNSFRPDVIFVDSDPISVQTICAGVLQLRRSAHVVCISCDNVYVTLHHSLRHSFKALVRALGIKLLSQLSRRLVSHVFCISSDIQNVILQYGFRERCSVIPLGFPLELFRRDSDARHRLRAQYGIPVHDLVIGFFGRVAYAKGVHVLVKALYRILDERWWFLIDSFGETNDVFTSEVDEMLRAPAIRQRVIRFSARHEEIPSYMNCCDVAVLPSITTGTSSEQYGRVVPEAMACGCCVVISDCGALPEVSGGFGVVVPEGDDKALADTLRQLVRDPERVAALGLKGLEYAQRERSSDAQALSIAEVLRQL